MMRTVNVKGESVVKGGKCTTEKMSPRPRTVTSMMSGGGDENEGPYGSVER